MATTPININFDNCPTEHMRAVQLYYQTTFFYKFDKVIAILLLLVGLTGIMTAGLHWWTVALIALAPVTWYNLLSALRFYLTFRSNPKYREHYDITFSQEELHFKTATIDSQIQWTLYHQLLEDEQLFVLVYGKWMYSVIPKRAFTDTAAQNTFRELAKQIANQTETVDEQRA